MYGFLYFPGERSPLLTLAVAAYEKQKDLLSSETGHFSLIRAMHLADLITELNGTSAI